MQDLSIATYVCGARFGAGHEQFLQTIYINSAMVATKVSVPLSLSLVTYIAHTDISIA